MPRQQEGSRATRSKSDLHMTKADRHHTQAIAISVESKLYPEVGLWEHGLAQQSQEGLWGAGHGELWV